jgi:hypothetical protein
MRLCLLRKPSNQPRLAERGKNIKKKTAGLYEVQMREYEGDDMGQTEQN